MIVARRGVMLERVPRSANHHDTDDGFPPEGWQAAAAAIEGKLTDVRKFYNG